MACTRHIIVCEGKSEWTYLRRLQSFLDKEAPADGGFETSLRLIAPERVVAGKGAFGALESRYRKAHMENRRSFIKIWTDFDLCHRNDKSCADHYASKSDGVPDFHFSFHNFEDFLALHWDGELFERWLRFGEERHFAEPLHAADYIPEFLNIFPGYAKGALAHNFITWDSLKNLKRNRVQRPTSNPRNLQGIQSFADFLVGEIETAYPGSLE